MSDKAYYRITIVGKSGNEYVLKNVWEEDVLMIADLWDGAYLSFSIEVENAER